MLVSRLDSCAARTMTIVRSEFDSCIDLTPGGHQRALERALLKDPTRQELRRIAAATGTTTSIADSNEELKAKIQARAPEALAQNLSKSLSTLLPAFSGGSPLIAVTSVTKVKTVTNGGERH